MAVFFMKGVYLGGPRHISGQTSSRPHTSFGPPISVANRFRENPRRFQENPGSWQFFVTFWDGEFTRAFYGVNP